MEERGSPIIRFMLMPVLIAVLLMVCILLPVKAHASTGEISVKDNAGLYSKDDLTEIRRYLSTCYDQVNYMVITEDTPVSDIDKECRALYKKRFGNKAGNALLINNNLHKASLQSFGDMDTDKISSKSLNKILDKAASGEQSAADPGFVKSVFSQVNRTYTETNGVSLVPEKTWAIFLEVMVLIIVFVLIFGLITVYLRDHRLNTKLGKFGRVPGAGAFSDDNETDDYYRGGSVMNGQSDENIILKLSLIGFIASINPSVLTIMSAVQNIKEKGKGDISVYSLWLAHSNSLPRFLLMLGMAFAVCSFTAYVLAAKYRKTDRHDLKVNLGYWISVITLLLFLCSVLLSITMNPAILVFFIVAAVLVLFVSIAVL